MERRKDTEDPATWLKTAIEGYINCSPDNSLQNQANEKAWAEPLVGFSSGDDPLYPWFKDHIGPFHLTPLEIFKKTFPRSEVAADQLTVISWILPQTEATKFDNRVQKVYPSERWVRARIYGEEVNRKLCKYVVESLRQRDYEAVAPMLSPLFEWKTSERYGFASTWSERHAAYASGLGTFGLCDGLITSKGKAVRCGSVVARIQVTPTERPYADHRAYCLFHSKGTCGKCIERCPVGAITKEGHNKKRCQEHLEKSKEHIMATFGFEGYGYGCGLCQTGVPCESRIPSIQ